MWPYTQLARTSATQSPMVNSALEKRTAMSISSHRLEAPVPTKKGPPPHVPLTMLKPVLNSLTSPAQKEARQGLFFRPPTRATKWTSVMKEPSTSSVPPLSCRLCS